MSLATASYLRYIDGYHASLQISQRLANFLPIRLPFLHWSPNAQDALWIAALKDDNALITIHADCEYAGIKATAHVGIYVKDARRTTIVEIIELFDKEVDDFIARRVKVGMWGKDKGGT